MTLGERCQEILRLIDEALEPARTPEGSQGACAGRGEPALVPIPVSDEATRPGPRRRQRHERISADVL